MRAVVFGAALACVLAGGCKQKAPACDAVSLGVVRTQLAKVAGKPGPDPAAVPMTAAADGAGRVKGAARVRWPDGSTQRLDLAIATAETPVLELEGKSSTPYAELAAALRELDEGLDVRLVVVRRSNPPTGTVAPWAIEAAATRAVPIGQYDTRNRILDRALGPRCAAALLEAYKTSGKSAMLGVSREEVAEELPAALEKCGCQGADLATAAWLFELIWFPRYEQAWLKLPVGPKTLPADAIPTLQDLADQLEAARR